MNPTKIEKMVSINCIMWVLVCKEKWERACPKNTFGKDKCGTMISACHEKMERKMRMAWHKTGCIVCGKPLQYTPQERVLTCHLCGREFSSDTACEDGHYICDECHGESALQEVTAIALNTEDVNPVRIAAEMMKEPFVNMHGPEHHYIVPAAMLAAYGNLTAGGNLEARLARAKQRAKAVPGGICGRWGSCGAAIGVGIFFSIVTEATPLSEESWGTANLATSRCLAQIARYGGPRCCKRDARLALEEGVVLAKELLGVEMETGEKTKCGYFNKNEQCKKFDCPYYPFRPQAEEKQD